MRALLGDVGRMAAMDWRVVPLPWQEHLANPGRALKVRDWSSPWHDSFDQIGFFVDDGLFPATPGMVRAVRETVELLRKAGHQVFPQHYS